MLQSTIPSPTTTFLPPPTQPRYGRHSTFPTESPKRTIPCPPRSEAFSCFCLSRNLSFPVAISWTTYSDTFADQTLRSCRNFHNFFSRVVEENDFWRGKESGRIQLAVLGLAVRGPYENEYFRAMWLLQATVYLLFSVIHVDNFQLYTGGLQS